MKSSPKNDDAVLERNVETLLGSVYDPPTIDRGARQRMRDHLIATAAKPERARAPRRWSPLMMAGTALVAGGVAVMGVAQLVGPVEAPAGAVARDGNQVTLADGTVAVVGKGGAIDAIGARHVRVTGQVYLDVAMGQGRFQVETDAGHLEVLGTRFVVDAKADQTTAAVLRGAVQMTSGGSDVVVRAGQQGTMRAGAVPVREPAPRLSKLVGWAQQAREHAETDQPKRRSGTLYARNPQWQEQDFPLPLKQLTLDVVVENQVARVAVDQTFHNPQPQQLEGVYRFTVPPDAALSRLAMYVDGELQEAAVVERQAARRIYEDIVYRRRDPALAEWAGAGRVDLRIFPLNGNDDKRLIAAYTQTLPRLYDDWTLTVPLPDLDEPVDDVAIKVRVADCGTCEIHSPSHDVEVAHDGDAAIVTYHRAGDRVGDSLVLDVRDPDTSDRVASARQGDDQFLLVRSRPDLGTSTIDHRARKYVILDDVSASRGVFERKAQAELVDRLIDTIDEDDQVLVATFDVAVRGNGDFQRAADVDRHAIKEFLDKEHGGVGATNLSDALGWAAQQLAGTDARDAYVVYLGDGVVTGGSRDLAALEQMLEDKATFVGFAVGDGADVPSLGQLAGATGGLVVPIDPADDLGYRALDAVAVLYTSRVTGLRATVLDAAGHQVSNATAHVRGQQLADGDELEVVIRAPESAEIAAVEVTGSQNGATWSHRIAATERTQGAAYLPRLWAQRQVQSMILARNTAPAPQACTAEPCATYEEQRVAYREGLRKEIAALGKEYFLLSPHTSLIVLENDAMYVQYGVEKGKDAGWAPYALPAKIAVTAPSPANQLGGEDGVALVRTPIQLFYDYGGYYYDDGIALAREQQRWRGAGNTGVVTVTAAVTEEGGRFLRGETRAPSSTATPALAPVAGADAAEKSPDPADRMDNDKTTVDTKNEAEGTLFLDEIATGEGTFGTIGTGTHSWTVGGKAGAKQKKGKGWTGRNHRSLPMGTPYPQAWNYAADYRLDDLTEMVPAFFADELDQAIAELKAAAGSANGSITDDARALLDAARGSLTPGVYRWGDGPDITVDRAGRMSWKVTHDTGLVEVATFDGQVMRRQYAELGLETRRDLGDAAPAVALVMLPLVAPDPDALARWYAVTKVDAHTLALAPARAPDAPTLHLVLDDDHHVTEIRTASGTSLLTIRWDGGQATGASVDGTAVAIGYVASNITDATATADTSADVITVGLPLRPPAYWTNQRAEMAAGTEEWRRATRDLMAAQAATKDVYGSIASLRELETNGGFELGDVVLASGGLSQGAPDKDLVDLLTLGGDRSRVVGRYLSASRAYGKSPKAGTFSAVVSVAGDGLIATLAHHRETLALSEADKLSAALDSLEATDRGGPNGVLKLIAASTIAQRHSYTSPRAVEAWDAVATGEWRNLARYEAVRALYNRGDYAGAATRAAELMSSFDLDAMPVQIDWTARQAMQYSPRGDVGWQLSWSAYRNRVLDAGDLQQVMALLASSAQVGGNDTDRVLGKAADLAAGDADALAQIVGYALSLGQIDRAAPLLDKALAVAQTPDLLRLASTVSERQGRIVDAADYLQKALDADGDGPVALSQVRADLSHLLALRGRTALLATGADREAGLDAALEIANRWRDLDADNPQVDRQIGELLLAGGRRDEAWRQLSTAIERHPTDGDGWALVAEVMEKEGRLDDAVGYWQQAVVIDQTNPTWRLRKAQALFALGRDADAKALLKEITSRTWHDRWANVVWQVQTMVSQLETVPVR